MFTNFMFFINHCIYGAYEGAISGCFVHGPVRFWFAGGSGPGISQFAFILSHVVVSLEWTFMV